MNKLNKTLQKWPPGTIVTSDWLKEQGIYKQLVDSYKNTGWIKRVGRGAFKRTGEQVSWEGGLYALQQLQHLPVHVGGKTALELHGLGHYVNMASEKILLWKTPDVRLPVWFKSHEWKSTIELRSASLFATEKYSLTQTTSNQIDVIASSPERAILEHLYDVPKHEGFDEASYIMEGLTSLRPIVLQYLLEACKSIRVKRLFMYLADYYHHRWFDKLDPSTIDLGKGKRVIVEGAQLDKKYQIVVPKLKREEQ